VTRAHPLLQKRDLTFGEDPAEIDADSVGHPEASGDERACRAIRLR
jgi:hypothetical protein